MNPESKFALETFNMPEPPLMDDYYKGEEANRNVCMVDHNSKS